MMIYDIGIILTCFNRKDLTIRCIKQLSKSNSKYKVTFYVCDDASTDGTTEAIKNFFPDVVLVDSPGNLYWCRGMYQAMREALSHQHSLYLMVNDDVDFLDGCIDEMVDTYISVGTTCGVVGYTISKKDGSITYGGRRGYFATIFGKNAGVKGYSIVKSSEKEFAKCLLANWNCFLVDSKTVDRVGLIDRVYEHGIGDYDYSLMMNELSIPIYVTRNSIGYCERNEKENTFRDKNLNRLQRIRELFGPKGYPIKSRYHYHVKHWGIAGAIYVSLIYLKCIAKILIGMDI